MQDRAVLPKASGVRTVLLPAEGRTARSTAVYVSTAGDCDMRVLYHECYRQTFCRIQEAEARLSVVIDRIAGAELHC